MVSVTVGVDGCRGSWHTLRTEWRGTCPRCGGTAEDEYMTEVSQCLNSDGANRCVLAEKHETPHAFLPPVPTQPDRGPRCVRCFSEDLYLEMHCRPCWDRGVKFKHEMMGLVAQMQKLPMSFSTPTDPQHVRDIGLLYALINRLFDFDAERGHWVAWGGGEADGRLRVTREGLAGIVSDVVDEQAAAEIH